MTMSPDLPILFDKWRERIDALIREHPLQIISWEATRRCNLRCVHCGSPAEEAEHGQELSTDEIVGAFEEIARDFDMDQFRHINITGGEPFVRGDLLEVLRRINRFPFYRNIDIQTNGIILADQPELFDELKQYGVTGLGTSIDGLEPSHDAFRQMRGSWKKALAAARLAVKHGYTATVSVVAHAKNIDEIPELFELVKRDIHPRVFRVMTIDPLGRTSLDSEYLLSPQQLGQVIGFLKTEYQQSCHTYADPTSTMVELGCGGWLDTELEGMVRPFIFHCIAGITNLGILYDGKLAACSNISREFVEGDLSVDRIRDVWDTRYERFRGPTSKRTGICHDCTEWTFCHGGPMHKRLRDGSLSCCLHKTYESNGQPLCASVPAPTGDRR